MQNLKSVEKFKVRWRFSQKRQILGSVPVAAIPNTFNFYILGEKNDTRWCRNTQEINPYPKRAIKVALNDGVE